MIMKRVLLIAAILVSSAFAANAQDQGDWYVGGTIGVDYTKMEDDKNTNFLIAPSINYMISDNWALGLGLGYEYNKTEEEGYETKDNLFFFQPQATYVCNIAGNFYYTPKVFVKIGFGTEDFGGPEDIDLFQIGGGVSPLSFEFRPAPRVGISFSAGNLSFMHSQAKLAGEKAKADNFNFSFNTDFKFGFNYYF